LIQLFVDVAQPLVRLKLGVYVQGLEILVHVVVPLDFTWIIAFVKVARLGNIQLKLAVQVQMLIAKLAVLECMKINLVQHHVNIAQKVGNLVRVAVSVIFAKVGNIKTAKACYYQHAKNVPRLGLIAMQVFFDTNKSILNAHYATQE